jgi:hypothetical protein
MKLPETREALREGRAGTDLRVVSQAEEGESGRGSTGNETHGRCEWRFASKHRRLSSPSSSSYWTFFALRPQR